MAFRVDTAAEGLAYESSSFDWVPMTCMVRFRRIGSGGSSADRIVNFFNASYGGVRIYLSGTAPYAYCEGGSAFTVGVTISDNTWYDYILVISGTGSSNAKLYVGQTGGALSSATGTGPTASSTTAFAWVGLNDATYYPNGDIDDFRLWTAALTESEIEIERAKRRPSRTSDLYWWSPLIGSTLTAQAVNYGTGPSLSFQGSAAVIDGAPVGWGAPIIVPQYVVVSSAPVLSLPGVQSITATTAVPKVTLTFS